MLQKLRWKFILINMSLVFLVLLLLALMQVAAAVQQQRDATNAALRLAIAWPEEGPDPLELGDSLHAPAMAHMVPALCIAIDGAGELRVITDGTVHISQESLEDLVELVLDRGSAAGELEEAGLRYLLRDGPGETRVAFADLTWEQTSLRGQLLTLFLALAAALGGFFLISLFLSRWALKPVERSWKQQQQFIADASHELKTPLTVILADTGLLLAHPEDTVDKQRKWVEYIRAEAGRMKALVEDMLFLARSDNAAAPVRQPCSLTDLAWSCLLPFEAVAFEAGVTLNSQVEEGLTIQGDQEQLRRLIMILLDNACKYAGAGGSVEVSLARRQDRLCLTVDNTGEPIPPEHLPHLFERFYRSDPARSQGGYGLGLAIAQAIVAGHRGTISVSSSREEGTRFTVLLPRQ